MRGPETPKFICDEMLKKMARWLRILGYDTTDPSVENDNELAELSKKEERILLTRDKDLSSKKGIGSIRIISDDLEEQLKQILKQFPPHEYHQGHTRCPSCNGILSTQILNKTNILELEEHEIPKDVITNFDRVYICIDCRKVYWTGSHWAHILERSGRIGAKPILPPEQ